MEFPEGWGGGLKPNKPSIVGYGYMYFLEQHMVSYLYSIVSCILLFLLVNLSSGCEVQWHDG